MSTVDRFSSVLEEAKAKQNGSVSPEPQQKPANDSRTELSSELDKARQVVKDQTIAYVAGGFIEGLESVSRGDFGEYQSQISEAVGKFSTAMKSRSRSTLPEPRFTLNPGG